MPAAAPPRTRQVVVLLTSGLAGAFALAAAVMGLGLDLGLGRLGSVLLFVWGALILGISWVMYTFPGRAPR